MFHVKPREQILDLSLKDISPNKYQPRQNFKQEDLLSLSQSIKEKGLVQPVVVRRREGRYELISGQRRWQAAELAGLERIPAIVREVDDQEQLELALIENLQREDLNPIERSKGYKTLLEKFGLTQEELARTLGKKRSTITNSLRLLNLPQGIQKEVAQGKMSEGHARVLLTLPRQEKAILEKKILQKSISVREAERIARRKKGRSEKDKEKEFIEDELKRSLGTKVSIRGTGQKGSIVIEYYSGDELARLLEMLGISP